MKFSPLARALAATLFLLFSIGNATAAEKLQAYSSADASQTVQFGVYLPLQNSAALDQLLIALQTPGSSQYHQWLTPSEFNSRFGANPAAIASIAATLKSFGLQVVSTDAHGLQVQGTVAAIQTAFGVTLSNALTASGANKLIANQPLVLPPALLNAGAHVVDFSSFVRMQSRAIKQAGPLNRYSDIGGYWFDDLKQAYSYPSYKAYTGRGVTIGILMTGSFDQADMDAYFSHENLATPRISEVEVLGGLAYDPNNPFNDAETFLDIQQSGGMAPGAHIVLYNIPDLSDASILTGLATIIDHNRADVVNMSFGGPEIGYLPEYNDGVDFSYYLGIYDDVFRHGNAQGITFVAAAGDLGARDVPAPACFDANATAGCGGFEISAETPASSPHVTGVGGTNLLTTYNPPSLDSAYVSENAFGDPLTEDIFYGTPASGGYWGSGGGISFYYPKPSYQYLVNSPSHFRTVPDVALHMGGCPEGAVTPCNPNRSFDWVGIAGSFYGFIGTSASSPDFVGLTALKIERLGTRLGNENYEIYSLSEAQEHGRLPFQVYRQDIHGFNGVYHAHPGYNLVVGNGTIYGKNFILAPNVPAAGVPQTPSNP